jgi:hypothetical protein
VVIDTDRLDIDHVVDLILQHIRERPGSR